MKGVRYSEMMIRRTSSLTSLVICLGSCAPAATQPSAAAPAAVVETPPASAPPRAKPKFGTFGVDLDGRDATVRPGDDFYRHAGGRWLKESKIPSDRTRWGTFEVLRDEAEANVRALIEELANTKPAPGTNAQKAAEFYATYLDTAAIDQKGFAPAKAALDAIAAAKTLDDIAKLMARPDLPSKGPIAAGVSLDQKDPDHYVVIVLQSGLGLPEREFYLKNEQQFQEIRTKYEAHIAKVLAMVGEKRSAENAKAILDLETRIAERHWPIAERRQRDKTYNPRTLVELRKEAPTFPWKTYFE
ncbi:MAG: M13 family metallopeptidase N-terminal domain-containing protein, partial [Polyangiaceae bacterium]